jgi:hypothetical protein
MFEDRSNRSESLITKKVSFVNQRDKNEWEIGIGIKSFDLTIFGIFCNDTVNDQYPDLLKYRALVEFDLGYISVH